MPFNGSTMAILGVAALVGAVLGDPVRSFFNLGPSGRYAAPLTAESERLADTNCVGRLIMRGYRVIQDVE